jgi:drug/metabolite transporter (DMT)-like permease
MLYMLLAVIFAALLVIIFKFFERFSVNTFPAIVINYATCTFIAFLFIQDFSFSKVLNTSWVGYAFLLGSIFISIFFLTSQTARYFGASTAAVSMKLGLVFPIMLSAIVYHETFGFLKIAGLVFALIAVVLTSWKNNSNSYSRNKLIIILPAIVFVGSGLCDSMVQFMQKTFVSDADSPVFTFSLFLAALVAGFSVLIMSLFRRKPGVGVKELIGGIALGIPNYFSIYFLLKALNQSGLESSAIFPVVNIGTVAAATIFSIIYFKEKLSIINWLGLAFAGIGIIFMFQ